MDRDHELSAVLADDTRYNIYRWIAGRPGTDVTVADVAGEFGLHPNVARMHLSKLEQAGFLATGFRRAAGGGRPAKLYRLSEKVVTFGFPPRRYELLSRLALDSLSAGGTRDDAMRVCREAGVAEGRRALAGDVRAAARPRGGGRPRRADHRGAGPAAGGRLAGRLPQRRRQQLQLPRALRRRPRSRVRHAPRLPRGHHPGGHRRPGPPRDRSGRLSHQLRRRALRDAVLLRIGRGVREARSRVVYGRTRTRRTP